MDDTNRIYIFDTTLRDGEQSPGASLDEKSKLAMNQKSSSIVSTAIAALKKVVH